MRRLLHFGHALLLCAWLIHAPTQAEGVVHLIASDTGGAYDEVIAAFRETFKSTRPIRTWSLADLDAQRMRALSAENDLIVPIGLKAAVTVAGQRAGQASVLTLMVPHLSAQRLDASLDVSRRKLSHVHIDQPASRTLGLVEAVFPQVRRVGLVLSAENGEVAKAFQQETERRRLSLKLERVASAEELAPALRSVLPEVDVLLLVPDAVAFHAGNARNVLLTTYRYRVPVVGFSQGLSKAGAVAAVYSSPAQIGRQGARMAMRWKPESGELPPAQHAEEFSISFNPYVARSLGIVLPAAEDVGRKLGASVE
jgi:ABC-type uncharacterized transport system substrate-binding protein